jgi:spore maturation protein CgeB
MFGEMTRKYAQSKIVFNQAINNDVGMRPFEAMCSGSCLVSPRIPDMERLGFRDGVHYAAYSDLDELRAVVKDLLSNDAKREGIARNGRRIATQHTYAVRLRELLERLPKLQETK